MQSQDCGIIRDGRELGNTILCTDAPWEQMTFGNTAAPSAVSARGVSVTRHSPTEQTPTRSTEQHITKQLSLHTSADRIASAGKVLRNYTDEHRLKICQEQEELKQDLRFCIYFVSIVTVYSKSKEIKCSFAALFQDSGISSRRLLMS